MPQTTTTHNPCPECRPVFEGQRSHYCREFLRYQRENFSQRTEINALEVQLKHALEKLLKAERECIQAWKTSQQSEPVAYFDFQEHKFSWAKHVKIGPVPVSIKVEPMKLYSETPQQQAVIAGALFDFMGWLTTRKEQLVLSSVDNASPAADAIKAFAKMRGLSLDDARVQDWQNQTIQETPKCSPA